MRTGAHIRIGAACAAAALAAALCGGTAIAAGPTQARRATSFYHTIAIVKPARGETVFDNSGDMDVKVAVSPALDAAGGDRIELALDGRTASVGNTTRFRLGGVERGEHSLEARVLDSGGEVLISSRPVHFQMWRASRLFPNRHGK